MNEKNSAAPAAVQAELCPEQLCSEQLELVPFSAFELKSILAHVNVARPTGHTNSYLRGLLVHALQLDNMASNALTDRCLQSTEVMRAVLNGEAN